MFGNSTEEMAGTAGVPVLGILPLDPEFVTYSDSGKIEEYFKKQSTIRASMEDTAELVGKKFGVGH
ncbi:MAG: hypothetical protein ACYC21_07575 [Eubacteriales bacterium]